MYYEYVLSSGEYSDYSDVSIFHKEKFTTTQFIKMYNYAINLAKAKNSYFYFEELAEIMCEQFDFIQFEVVAGVHSGYCNHQKIPLEQVDDDCKFINLEDIKIEDKWIF